LSENTENWFLSNFRGWQNIDCPNTPELNVTRVNLGINVPKETSFEQTWGFRIEDRIPVFEESSSQNKGEWDFGQPNTFSRIVEALIPDAPDESKTIATTNLSDGYEIGSLQADNSPSDFSWAYAAINAIKANPLAEPLLQYILAGLYIGIIEFFTGESTLSFDLAKSLVLFAEATLGFRAYIPASKNLVQFIQLFPGFEPKFIQSYTSQDQVWFDQDYNFAYNSSYAAVEDRKNQLTNLFLPGKLSLRECILRLAGLRVGFMEKQLSFGSLPNLLNQSDINENVLFSLEYITRFIKPVYSNAYQMLAFTPQRIDTNITFSSFIKVTELISGNDGNVAIGIGLFPRNARGLQDIIDVSWASVGNEFPVNKIQRITASIKIPANKETFAVLMVRAPKGISLLWDFMLEWDGGLINIDVDKNTIIERLVDHLSGNPQAKWRQSREHPFWPLAGVENYGKTDVKIKFASNGSRKHKVDRIYKFGAGSSGLNAITELTNQDDNTYWKMVFSINERWLAIEQKQTIKNTCPIYHTPSGGNIIGGFGWQWMGEQAANVITVQSSQGSSRQAISFNKDFFQVTIEETTRASEDDFDDRLYQLADMALFYKTQPQTIGVKIYAEPFLSDHNLEIGDILPIKIETGKFNLSKYYRISQMTLNVDDTLDLMFTPVYSSLMAELFYVDPIIQNPWGPIIENGEI
jgi:hypothetical protein